MTRIDFSEFRTIAISIAEKYHASIDDEQAEEYAKNLFDDFLGSGKKNAEQWLESQLKDAYQFMAAPPEWVGKPRWAYFKGRPMIFLNQFKVASTDKKFIRKFPVGDMVYVFGSKNPPNPKADESWGVTYRLTVQTEEGEDVILSSGNFGD